MVTMKIKLPTNDKLCPHDLKHETWIGRDGVEYGICMMAPSHIQSVIRLLLNTVQNGTALDSANAIEILAWFTAERERRKNAGKWHE